MGKIEGVVANEEVSVVARTSGQTPDDFGAPALTDMATSPSVEVLTRGPIHEAFAEVVDHTERRGADQRRRAETRFNVTLSGVGMEMKRRAFETAKRFAGLAGEAFKTFKT